VSRGYSGGGPIGRSPWRPNPHSSHPADRGPPLEDLDTLIGRAELDTTMEWERDHGELPWAWPTPPIWSPDLDPAVREAMSWPQRWFAEHLFELPPLGRVPNQWLVLFG
jgi:hypothetical protein